jgi:selenocysteine lyase/cysteine desulfurase
VTAITADFEAIRRDQFPIVDEWAYLNHASIGPLPRANVASATACLAMLSETNLRDAVDVVVAKETEIRALAATLMRCEPADVALLRSTGSGPNLVAQGLDWVPGDEVVTYELEHANAVFPWVHLADRGVTVRYVPDRGHRFEIGDVAARLSPRTRVVCLSLVNFAHGFRAPIETIGELCRQRGIWLVVDAVQALGVLDVDVPALGADVVTAHAYKWLLGGFGLAIAYCSPRARRELRVPEVGWMARANASDLSNLIDFSVNLADDGRRFEPSEPNLPALFGLAASLGLIHEVGIRSIEARVSALVTDLGDGLHARGYEVVSSTRPEERSGIVAARREGMNGDAIRAAMDEARVACSVREGRVRVAPHFYNSVEDVGRFLAALP